MNKYKNKEWLEKAFLEIGNKVEIGRMCDVSSDTIEYWRKKFNIPKSDKGIQSNRKFKINEDYFKVIDSEEKAYWLGFIMADGCITKANANGDYNRFEINLKEDDIEHIEKMNKSFDSNYPIKTINNTNKKLNFKTSICSLRISCKKFVDSLRKNGITPNKTGKENIPNTIPYCLIKHFIRGFFDGDGSITINKSFRICSSSINILQEINDYFEKSLQIRFKIYSTNKYNVPFYVIDSLDTKKNKKVLSHLYDNSNIYLDRKFNRYLKLFCPITQ